MNTSSCCTPGDSRCSTTTARVRSAPVELVEHDHGFTVYADVPGADPASIELTVEDGILRVDAIRPARTDDRPEIRYRRAFRLAEEMDVDAIEARCENGVLQIDVPRLPETTPRRIPVRGVN